MKMCIHSKNFLAPCSKSVIGQYNMLKIKYENMKYA